MIRNRRGESFNLESRYNHWAGIVEFSNLDIYLSSTGNGRIDLVPETLYRSTQCVPDEIKWQALSTSDSVVLSTLMKTTPWQSMDADADDDDYINQRAVYTCIQTAQPA